MKTEKSGLKKAQAAGEQAGSKPGNLPRDIQAALNKVMAYTEKHRPQPAAGEIEAQARKDREQDADDIYSNLLDRAGYLREQASLLFEIKGNKLDLPENLSVTFAEMMDKAEEIESLARQLFEVAAGTDKAEPGSKEA